MEERSKKNILLFGANSFVAKGFIDEYKEAYNFLPVYRKKNQAADLVLDFTDVNDIKDFAVKVPDSIDGIIFFQGINPSMGLKDITDQHFIDMLRVNLVTPTLLIQSLQNQFAVGASLIFFSSVAKKKGSYDPSYASAKAGLSGLMHSICNAMPHVRCNMISLGLVENSPVYNQMTDDFREKHANRMQNKRFIQVKNINSMIELLLNNESINRADMALDGGYT